MINKANVICITLLLWSAAGLVLAVTIAAGSTRGLALGAAGLIFAIAVGGRVATRWFEPLIGGLIVTALAVAAWGMKDGEPVVLALGVTAAIVVGTGAGLATSVSEASRQQSRRSPQQSGPEHELKQLMERIHEHSMLSDTAKRVLFRERELQLLRDVIEEDINRGDYNAALRLCDDMAQLFGYREEAEAYRARLAETRQSDHQTQIDGALEQLDTFLTARDWAAAYDVAGRIRRLFPDSHDLQGIDNRIHRAREDHKHELEEGFREAVDRQDISDAMAKLRELDRYLNREEAARIADLAQDVVAKHRDNLSVQFKLAVNDHRWADAARIGDEIIAEFPNTKMAGEVRSMIDVLRTRASQAAVAEKS